MRVSFSPNSYRYYFLGTTYCFEVDKVKVWDEGRVFNYTLLPPVPSWISLLYLQPGSL